MTGNRHVRFGRGRAETRRTAMVRRTPTSLTVAIRGPLAEKMREMAESHGMSLAKLLQDAVLVLEERVEEGHEVGTALAEWNAQRGERASKV